MTLKLFVYDFLSYAFLNCIYGSVFFNKFYMSMSMGLARYSPCLPSALRTARLSHTAPLGRPTRPTARPPHPLGPPRNNGHGVELNQLWADGHPAWGPPSTCCRCTTSSSPSPTTWPSPSRSSWTPLRLSTSLLSVTPALVPHFKWLMTFDVGLSSSLLVRLSRPVTSPVTSPVTRPVTSPVSSQCYQPMSQTKDRGGSQINARVL